MDVNRLNLGGSTLKGYERPVLNVGFEPAAEAMKKAGPLREAVLEIYSDLGAGEAQADKVTIELAPGHLFRAMIASHARHDLSAVKWLGVAPGADGGTNIHSSMLLSQRSTGRLLAVIEGEPITTARTAAMSAVAACYLASPTSEVIGFIGCGTQARSHLLALKDVLPCLTHVLAYSRRASTAQAFADDAVRQGYTAEVVETAQAAIERANVVVTGIPAGTRSPSFLDGRWIRPGTFVASVDLGRSWMRETVDVFDRVATDVKLQSELLAKAGKIGHPGPFDLDLATIASAIMGGELPAVGAQKSLFVFAGNALADLAAARLVYEHVLKAS